MTMLRFHRSGDIPIEFEGEILAAVNTSSTTRNEPAGRWYECQIARTSGGRYAVEVCYHTLWQDTEDDVDFAFYGDADEVLSWLQTFDPTAPVLGYPPGQQFQARQQRLHDVIWARWTAALTELLAVFPPERVA